MGNGRISVWLVGVLLMFCLVPGCSAIAERETDAADVIKVANYFASDHPQNIALRKKFKPLVEQNSDLKVQIYDNSQLGAEKQFYDGVRAGIIEMGVPGMIMQSDILEMSIPELPFLFEDYDHAKSVLDGPIGDRLLKRLEEKHGVHTLVWTANGFRSFSSNRPLRSIEDFQGFRLRMTNLTNHIAFGEAMGANVTPLPISEVFTALEQRVIDGQENPIATLRASGWYEVQADVLESRHMFSPNLYIVNSDFWDGLTPDQKKVLEEAARISADYEWELLQKNEAADRKFLQDNGVRFTTPDEEFKREMRKEAESVYKSFYAKNPDAEEIVRQIRDQATDSKGGKDHAKGR